MKVRELIEALQALDEADKDLEVGVMSLNGPISTVSVDRYSAIDDVVMLRE